MLTEGDRGQLWYVFALWSVNFILFSILNGKKSLRSSSPSKFFLFASNYILFLTLLFLEVWMDSRYKPSTSMSGLMIITIKSYSSSFCLSLLDFYFSKVDWLSWRVVPGAATWALCNCFSMFLLSNYFGGPSMMKIVQLPDLAAPMTWLQEYARFILIFIMLGFYTDLMFSPMHRLAHSSRWAYTNLHGRHHSFRAHLTSLVIYHAEELDDLMMASCPIVGFVGMAITLRVLGMGNDFMLTNISWYMMHLMLAYSHASDVRLASLIMSLPTSLNFIAYHHNHHLDPSCNFGLTLPSDMIWDFIFRKHTIKLAPLQSNLHKKEAEQPSQAGEPVGPNLVDRGR